MNLNRWISYKTELKRRNKNIRICIKKIKISSGQDGVSQHSRKSIIHQTIMLLELKHFASKKQVVNGKFIAKREPQKKNVGTK